MAADPTRGGAIGLQAEGGARDWIVMAPPGNGVELMQARFAGRAFGRHRHDTFAICLTDQGVQGYNYRGAARLSQPGEVFVLHPDEPHDGHAVDEEGFGYRSIYVTPARIADAAAALCGRALPLPFVGETAGAKAGLAQTIGAAFAGFPCVLEPLAVDALISALTEGLVEADPSIQRYRKPVRQDQSALERGRALLEAECTRVVTAEDLEQVSGLDRFVFARQFRSRFGTSPYRYLLMRRLDRVRAALATDGSLADIAAESGFADQAHMTRIFRAAFGQTPARYRAALRSG